MNPSFAPTDFREVVDADDVSWRVWLVPFPHRGKYVAEPGLPSGDPEPRSSRIYRAQLFGMLSRGWLIFESREERRMLSPAPEGWETFSDTQLLALIAGTSPVGKPAW